MKITIMTLVVAAAVGAAVSPGLAQEKLKAASPQSVPADVQEMPAAGSTAAVAGGSVATGSAKLGDAGAASKVGAAGLVAAPGTLTKVKARKD
jgi:hypothetical protein